MGLDYTLVQAHRPPVCPVGRSQDFVEQTRRVHEHNI